MKILFVCSGNKTTGISPILKNQALSLESVGAEVSYYIIIGRGFSGYIKNIYYLRQFLKKNKYDVVHAHYSLSAYVATLAGSHPLIVSLMGSDVRVKQLFKMAQNIFMNLFWELVIVKSEDMKKSISHKYIKVLPNGVNLSTFAK